MEVWVISNVRRYSSVTVHVYEWHFIVLPHGFLILPLALAFHTPLPAMRITLVNITKSPIIYHAGDSESLETGNKNEYPLQIALLPSSSTTTDLPRRCSKLTLIPKVELKHDVISSPIQPTDSMNKRASEPRFSIQVKSLKQSRLLAEIDGGEQCPWRICRTKVCLHHTHIQICNLKL